MKLLFYVLFLTAVSLVVTQADTNIVVKNPIATGISNRFLEGLTYWLDSAVNDVRALITDLEHTINNLINNLLGSLSNQINNLLSSIDGILSEVGGSKKLLDECVIRIDDLEHLKMKTQNLIGVCKSNLDKEISSVLTDIGKQRDRGNGLISSLTKSLIDCGNILFVTCIFNEQQSTLREIQSIANTVQSFAERIFIASDKATDCINKVDKNARQLADDIYRDIKLCVSNPAKN